VGRQAALQLINFLTINVILAAVLPVRVIGIFDIASSIIVFFQYFSDIGLAASLIQKKDGVEHEDIKTTFTIQTAITGILSLIIILGASVAGSHFHFDASGVWLIRILGLSFFLSSLKVIPSVMMERKLNFKPVVTTDVVEAVLLNGSLIFFVFNNYGIWSYVYAVLIKSVVGVIVMYLLAPIRLGIGINAGAAKKLMNFGIPFQINNLLALLKDRLVPLVVAGMVGPVGFGYIEWSQGYAFLPLQIMSSIITVTFPTFARLQDNKETLGRAIEKSLFVTCLAVYPIVFGIGALLPSVIRYVVSSKWQPAQVSFYFFAFSVLWSVISTTFTNALNAIGKVKLTLYLMIMWTILTWVLTPLLVLHYGFEGVAIASFLISFTSAITIIMVKRILEIRVFNAILLPIGASAAMSLLVTFFSANFVRDKLSVLLAIIFGAVVYGIIILIFGRKRLLYDLQSLRNHG
jgi:O-antigen/teichoic acid export membrane protein